MTFTAPSSRPHITLLSVLLISGFLLSFSTTATARPRTPEEISFAALQGRVWVLALVDFLHQEKLSEKDRKAVYALYLYHELKVAGLDTASAPAERAGNTELYTRTLGPEFLAKLTASIRVPFEKPYLVDSRLKISVAQHDSLRRHFGKLLDPSARGKAKISPKWLTSMELGTILLEDLQTSLDEWESGHVVDESENEKLYETVTEDLEQVIDRLNDDEDIINEAWQIAATQWLTE